MNVSARPEETVDIKSECMLLSAMVYLPWTPIRQQASGPFISYIPTLTPRCIH